MFTRSLSRACWISCGLSVLFGAAILTAAETDKLKKPEASSDVPLQRVVMFNSGVGFFDRQGTVNGDAQIELKFSVDDINDLLKSMIVQDLGGGHISAVTYGSKEPISLALKKFAIDLNGNPTLGQILNQVRGERVEINAPNPITGVILGVESKKRSIGDNRDVIDVEILNLLTDAGLRSVPMDQVGTIKLLNEKLDKEFRQALTVLARGHDADKKSVALSFLGDGKRKVRVGYIQQTPVWKTSYRLVLKDDAAPFLQGWAIVENTTEEDWNKVALTLISGRPISFIMNMYDPLYVQRPVVEPELYASLRPQTYGQDLAGGEREFLKKADRGDQLARRAGKGEARDAVEKQRIVGQQPRSHELPRARALAATRPPTERSTRKKACNRSRKPPTWANCSNTRSPRRSPCPARNRPCCRSSTNRSKGAKSRSITSKSSPSIRSTACG